MARAYGKIILLGEHAVVYGMPAIAAGLERGAEAEAKESAQATLQLGDRTLNADHDSEEARAFRALLDALAAPPLAVRASLEIPAGVGLGASAAIGVAVARAVAERVTALGKPLTDETILEAVRAWESVFHGTPSGIDAAAAFHGGCFRFKKGEDIERLQLPRPLHVAVALAGPAASTRQMVEGVKKLHDQKPELVGKTLEGIESLVDNAALCLSAGDERGLGTLMDYNQMLLSALFVSTPDIEHACRVARRAGAFGAKLTGAGGGGAVIAAVTEELAPGVLDAWKSEGIEGFLSSVG